MATSGSAADVASEHIVGSGALSCVMAKPISFNFGIEQDMLQMNPRAKRHEKKLLQPMGSLT